jgi:hypothetical protein
VNDSKILDDVGHKIMEGGLMKTRPRSWRVNAFARATSTRGGFQLGRKPDLVYAGTPLLNAGLEVQKLHASSSSSGGTARQKRGGGAGG